MVVIIRILYCLFVEMLYQGLRVLEEPINFRIHQIRIGITIKKLLRKHGQFQLHHRYNSFPLIEGLFT